MLNIIVACASNRVIGRNGRLPWSLKEDWAYFLEKTKTGVLVMGRRCFEEFGEHAKGRTIIVLSRNPVLSFSDARKAASLSEALSLTEPSREEVWICGGRQPYESALPLADRLYLTQIHAAFDGDVRFPDWRPHFPRELSRRESESDGVGLSFLVLGKALEDTADESFAPYTPLPPNA